MDCLVVVIYDGETEDEYDSWVQNNAENPAWLDELPPVYSSLGGENQTEDPEPDGCDNDRWEDWNGDIDTLDNNYHYDANSEIRSRETTGGHGHQACYDDDGDLIVATANSEPEIIAAAGTADHNSPPSVDHTTEDVWPFIRAAQLDGNPVESAGWILPTSLSDPLIRVGTNLRGYYRRRPPHTGDQIDAGSCIE